MLFKPNFCCNCGEKIERTEWGALTSRRFCEVCAVENRRYEWLPRAIVGLGVLASVFSIGVWIGRPVPSSSLRLSTGQKDPFEKLEVSASTKPGIKTEEHPTDQGGANRIAASASELPAAVSLSNKAANEPIYYCGAMTKKGTPCTRRVKVKGARCWQHVGKPSAALSQSVPDVY